MKIRTATSADAVAACDVLKRSIAELCGADHDNDQRILASWLANKTPSNVRAWIEDPAIQLLVAVDGEAVLSVGAVNQLGEITLNYVSPDARFRGISRAMLMRLEGAVRDRGHEVCRLTSTETAYRFYRSAGYLADGAPKRLFGTTSAYPMMKRFRDGTNAASQRPT